MSRRHLVAGNWKLHGSKDLCNDLAGALATYLNEGSSPCDIAVFPPAPYLGTVAGIAGDSGLGFGAQDISEHGGGAHTGEVAGAMLSEFGCTYALCGHSERRTDHGETSEQVARKVGAALEAGLTPVLCLGETLEDREADRTADVVLSQLGAVIDELGIPAFEKIVVAYEPVWAIGTGKTASPEQAQEVHALLRSKIAETDAIIAGQLRILYGGSVKGSNAAELFAKEDIDGALVGGASLQADSFLAICKAAPVVD